jgi:hypothetical protein
MRFATETRILFVCLEDMSGSLTSNLRRKRPSVRVNYLYRSRGLQPRCRASGKSTLGPVIFKAELDLQIILLLNL